MCVFEQMRRLDDLERHRLHKDCTDSRIQLAWRGRICLKIVWYSLQHFRNVRSDLLICLYIYRDVSEIVFDTNRDVSDIRDV